MTETEWLTSDDPGAMLAWLTLPFGERPLAHPQAPLSDRKLRLFACAWWSLWQPHLPVHAGRVEDTEAGLRPWKSLVEEMREEGLAGDELREVRRLQPVGAALLRDLLGNPFRPPSPPAVPRVYSEAGREEEFWARRHLARGCRDLARAIHDDRDFAALPVLADALEESGATDKSLLGHLRGPGPHVRGCWALDLVLGKE